jgi:hypothetical protein
MPGRMRLDPIRRNISGSAKLEGNLLYRWASLRHTPRNCRQGLWVPTSLLMDILLSLTVLVACFEKHSPTSFSLDLWLQLWSMLPDLVWSTPGPWDAETWRAARTEDGYLWIPDK